MYPVTASTNNDTQAPTVPANLRVTSATMTSITLAWDTSTDNVGVSGYDVYRDGVKIGTTQGPTITNTPLTPGKSYTYIVKAYDAADNYSDASAPLTAATNNDTQAPTVPTGLKAGAATETSISLSWSPSTDNVAVSGYDLYRDGVKVGTTPGLSIINSPLTPGKSYTYTVKAYDAAGNYSNSSDPVTISTVSDTQAPTAPTNVTAVSKTETTVSLSWSAATDNIGVAGYYVYRDGTKIGSTTGLTYTSTSLSPGKAYTYTVRAYDGAVNISNASDPLAVTTDPDTQAPSTPAGLTVASTTMTSVTLTWSASADNVAVTGYEVYRDGTKIGTTPGSSITNVPLTPGKTYNYTVKAYDASGNYSALSSPIAATTNSDTQAPTPPTGLNEASATETSITLVMDCCN